MNAPIIAEKKERKKIAWSVIIPLIIIPIVGVSDEMCGIPGNPCCKDLSDPTHPTGYCLSGTCVIDSLHPFPGIRWRRW